MSDEHHRPRIVPASVLLTLAAIVLSRYDLIERVYRERKRLWRRVRHSLRSPTRVRESTLVSQSSRAVTRLIHRGEGAIDSVKVALEERFDRDDPIMIMSYLGYGTTQSLYLKGRVLQDNGITPASVEDSAWRNLLNIYRRFESDEIPGARIEAQFGDQVLEVVTDEEGYFDLSFVPEQPLDPDELWHPISLRLLDPQPQGQTTPQATGFLLAPPANTQFGVISDVDDTIVLTNAESLLKMGRTVFMGNVHTRVPFAGVAAFYRALLAGGTGQNQNPLFYVSSSPWNLYDILIDFLDIHDIPFGPLMLRDWGISNDEVLPTKHAPHKVKSIRRIMDTFPHLPFILIGDSGQEDPEIYTSIVDSYPERILAVYIRSVSRNPERPDQILALAEEVKEAGSTLILAEDTLIAAQHAADQGWLMPESLEDIRQQVLKDRAQGDQGEKDAPPPMVVEGKE